MTTEKDSQTEQLTPEQLILAGVNQTLSAARVRNYQHLTEPIDLGSGRVAISDGKHFWVVPAEGLGVVPSRQAHETKHALKKNEDIVASINRMADNASEKPGCVLSLDGDSKRIGNKECPECKGAQFQPVRYFCLECGGNGDVELTSDYNAYTVECASCRGQGDVASQGEAAGAKTELLSCDRCMGTGKTSEMAAVLATMTEKKFQIYNAKYFHTIAALMRHPAMDKATFDARVSNGEPLTIAFQIGVHSIVFGCMPYAATASIESIGIGGLVWNNERSRWTPLTLEENPTEETGT